MSTSCCKMIICFSWIREWLGVYCQCCVVLTYITHCYACVQSLRWSFILSTRKKNRVRFSFAKLSKYKETSTKILSSLNVFTIIITLRLRSSFLNGHGSFAWHKTESKAWCQKLYPKQSHILMTLNNFDMCLILTFQRNVWWPMFK